MVIIVWDIAATLTLCWVTKASERIQMVWQVRDMIDTPFDQKNWFLFVFAGFSSLSYLSAHNNKKRCIKSFYIFHCFQTVDTRDRFDAIHRWTFQYQSHPKHQKFVFKFVYILLKDQFSSKFWFQWPFKIH